MVVLLFKKNYNLQSAFYFLLNYLIFFNEKTEFKYYKN